MRLIDVDALITFMKKGWRLFPSSELQHTCDMTDIENAPTIDAEPVRHGHWIATPYTDYDDTYECSVCGACWTFIEGTPKDNEAFYCPHCGAKMDEVEDGLEGE